MRFYCSALLQKGMKSFEVKDKVFAQNKNIFIKCVCWCMLKPFLTFYYLHAIFMHSHGVRSVPKFKIWFYFIKEFEENWSELYINRITYISWSVIFIDVFFQRVEIALKYSKKLSTHKKVGFCKIYIIMW